MNLPQLALIKTYLKKNLVLIINLNKTIIKIMIVIKAQTV